MRVVLTSPPLHGHVRPLVALGAELSRRGHDVHALVPEDMRELAPWGVDIHTYESTWSEGDDAAGFALPRDDVRSSRAIAAFAAQQGAVTDAYTALLDTVDPDVVVADTTAAHVAAHRGEHAVVWHSPTYVTAQMVEVLRAGDGVTAEEPILVAVAPSLHPTTADLAGLHFIGPQRSSVGRTAAPGTVFVSAGTSYNRDAALFADAILAMDGLPYRALVATGDPGVAARLDRQFPDARITAWVDQPSALADSAAFISTGGMGSLQQAVAAGVPTVVVPQSPEQRINASALVRTGCGIAVEPESVTPDLLTRAIRHLVAAPEVRGALSRLAEEIGGLGGVAEGADIVEQTGGRA